MPRQGRGGTRRREERGVLQNLAEERSLDRELRSSASSQGRPRPIAPTAGTERPRGADPVDLSHLRAVSCAVTAELDFGRLAREILSQARVMLGADRGILFFGRPDSIGLVPILAEGIHGEELRDIGRVSRTILAQSKAGELIHTENAPADRRFAEVRSIRENAMRSIIAGPLVAGSETIGVLYLDAVRAHAFIDAAVEFFRALASIAAVALANAKIHGDLVWENAALRARVPSGGTSAFDGIAGQGERMQEVLRQAETAARLDAPLLIVGEPGTGRRRLARAIHDASRRASGPFVTCECRAIPPSHLRGMLWGRSGPAAKARPHAEAGLVRQAEPGTLCVANSHALEGDLGAEVVRLAENLTFRPMGSRQDEHANLRTVLTAEPRILERRGRKRVGLVRVTQWFTLAVPSLRERPEDVPGIIEQILRSSPDLAARTVSMPPFSPEGVDLLRRHTWAGNVRELELVVRQLLLSSVRFPSPAPAVREVLGEREAPKASVLGPWSGEIRPLREWHDEAIRRALHQTGGNQAAAARLLGVHRNTVLKWVRESQT